MRTPKFSPRERDVLKAHLAELEHLKKMETLEYPDFYDHEIKAIRDALNECAMDNID